MGDFDCDGIDDIVMVGGMTDPYVLQLSDDAGGIAASHSLTDLGLAPLGTSGSFVVPADFNADGTLDLATTSTAGMSVLLGDGAGGFPERQDLGPETYPPPRRALDLVGSPHPELLVGEYDELRLLRWY